MAPNGLFTATGKDSHHFLVRFSFLRVIVDAREDDARPTIRTAPRHAPTSYRIEINLRVKHITCRFRPLFSDDRDAGATGSEPLIDRLRRIVARTNIIHIHEHALREEALSIRNETSVS
jgi:hypothetical protein